MITVLIMYLLLGAAFAGAVYMLGKKYKNLYWLVGGYFPLTLLFSTLFWPVFIPAVGAIVIIEYIMESK